MSRTIVLCAALGASAHAGDDPPTGYRCGEGKPKPGVGCACPSGFADKRDAEGNAICERVAVAPQQPPTTRSNPCAKLAERLGALASGPGGARERRAVETSCARDKWSADALRCASEKSRELLAACLKSKLTGEQDRAYESARRELSEHVRNVVAIVEKGDSGGAQVGRWFSLFAGRTNAFDDTADVWLGGIAELLLAHPEIEVVEIQAAVDFQPSNATLEKFRQARGELVRDALVKLGVARGRLTVATSELRGALTGERFVITKRAAPKKPKAIDVGDKLVPLEQVTEVDGSKVNLEKTQHAWHVDMFVATGCKPCVDGIAMLDAKLTELPVVAIDVTNDRAHRLDPTKLPHVHVVSAPQKTNPAIEKYAPEGALPVTLIVDPKNVVRYREVGMGPKHFEQLAAAIKTLVPR